MARSSLQAERRASLLTFVYTTLLEAAGPRGWWPGETRDEIIIGAVLTQNTAWKNVEQAIASLRAEGLLELRKLALRTPESIAPLIRPAGYFNLKARRLRSVADFFAPEGRERFEELQPLDTQTLRRDLLGVWGVGPETVDCILLYALGRPTFVIDAYTLRVLERHGFCQPGTDYHQAKELFAGSIAPDSDIYNEYHALLVWVGHHFCKPSPRCAACPLSGRESFATTRAWNALSEARKT